MPVELDSVTPLNWQFCFVLLFIVKRLEIDGKGEKRFGFGSLCKISPPTDFTGKHSNFETLQPRFARDKANVIKTWFTFYNEWFRNERIQRSTKSWKCTTSNSQHENTHALTHFCAHKSKERSGIAIEINNKQWEIVWILRFFFVVYAVLDGTKNSFSNLWMGKVAV